MQNPVDGIVVSGDDEPHGTDHPQCTPEALLADLGGSIPPGGRTEDSEGPERVAVFGTEEWQLRQAAEARGILDSGGSLIPISPDDGREHRVAYDPEGDVYFKTTHPGTYGGYMGLSYELDSATQKWVERPLVLQATPREYLDRLCLSNEALNDDIKVTRVVGTPEGLSIETSQPAIAGRPATVNEIRQEMEALGFRQVHHDGVFYRDQDQVLAWDLQGNSLITPDGAFAPIDAMLRTAPAELAAKIAAQP